MHEASLMNGLMKKIETLAEQEGAARVTQVNIWLGALSPMSAEHFREHFVESSRSTIAENAALVIDVSTDVKNPQAQELLLRSVEVEL